MAIWTGRLPTVLTAMLQALWRTYGNWLPQAVLLQWNAWILRVLDVGHVDRYRMVVLRSPDRAVRPGTVMGYLQPTAARGTYEARIYTHTEGDGVLTDAKPFRIVVTDDAMQFYRVRTGLSVNLFRMLPYMFRRAVDYRPDDHNGLDGCVRYRVSLPRYF